MRLRREDEALFLRQMHALYAAASSLSFFLRWKYIVQHCFILLTLRLHEYAQALTPYSNYEDKIFLYMCLTHHVSHCASRRVNRVKYWILIKLLHVK